MVTDWTGLETPQTLSVAVHSFTRITDAPATGLSDSDSVSV